MVVEGMDLDELTWGMGKENEEKHRVELQEAILLGGGGGGGE